MIDRVGGAVLVSDADQRFVFVSGSACALLGFDRADAERQVVGQWVGDLFGEDAVKKLLTTDSSMAATGAFRLEMMGNDGSAVDVNVDAVALDQPITINGSESDDVLWMIQPYGFSPVSYTHLTLPTIYSV